MVIKVIQLHGGEPKIIRGSHSVRYEYPDGYVEFESDWDKLKADVEQALAEYSKGETLEEPTKPKKPRAKRKSKSSPSD